MRQVNPRAVIVVLLLQIVSFRSRSFKYMGALKAAVRFSHRFRRIVNPPRVGMTEVVSVLVVIVVVVVV